MTARPTSRAAAKAGLSDPLSLNDRDRAQRIKATPGIQSVSHSDSNIRIKYMANNGETQKLSGHRNFWAIPWEVVKFYWRLKLIL